MLIEKKCKEFATKAEIEAGAACGQLAMLTDE